MLAHLPPHILPNKAAGWDKNNPNYPGLSFLTAGLISLAANHIPDHPSLCKPSHTICKAEKEQK
jgi:hypothetical protein